MAVAVKFVSVAEKAVFEIDFAALLDKGLERLRVLLLDFPERVFKLCEVEGLSIRSRERGRGRVRGPQL